MLSESAVGLEGDDDLRGPRSDAGPAVSDRRNPWVGTITVGPWWLLYRGAYTATGKHAHHATQIAIATDGRDIQIDDPDTRIGSAFIIPSDIPHTISSTGQASMLFIDADTPTSRQLCARAGGIPLAIAPPPSSVHDLDAGRAVVEILDSLHPNGVAPPPASPGIAAVLARLADDPTAGSLDAFAAAAGQSTGRFSRRFTDEVGIPLRSYRRWVRVLHAVEALADGSTLTDAAHRAGFADSAHLSLTFRDQFGLAPSDLFSAVRFEPLD